MGGKWSPPIQTGEIISIYTICLHDVPNLDRNNEYFDFKKSKIDEMHPKYHDKSRVVLL